jgi:hypothetical protein
MAKTKVNTQKQMHEIGMVAAVISDAILKKLYKYAETGYCEVVSTISDWAAEFEKKHRNTDWEEMEENPVKPLSNHFKKMKAEVNGKPQRGWDIGCWDDAVIDFAHYKFEQYKSRF